MKLKIGTIFLDNPTVFAPLAGITHLPMRLLAKENGCALVCSEMISANGLVFGSAKTRQLLDSCPQEKPLSVQLFGSKPDLLAEAARQVETAGADIVDINFGCSVKKILKSGSGAALMQQPRKAEELLKAVRKAVRVPLTLKMRSGWDHSGEQAMTLGRIAQECGLDAVTLHPRTARQGFGGKADWTLIERLKKTLSIPVIGNGDVTAADDARRLVDQTGCDAVMVGRSAIGNPFIFSDIIHILEGRTPLPASMSDRLHAMRRYLSASVKYLGETRACLMMRSRLAWFVKGLPLASQFRQSATRIASLNQASEIIDKFSENLQRFEIRAGE